MVFPLSSKVFAPRCYSTVEMRRHGVMPETIVWFRGFHTCYLKEPENYDTSSPNPLKEKGCRSPIILVRPEPELATFFDRKQDILEKTVHFLTNNGNAKEDFSVVVFPRTKEQALSYAKYPVTVMCDATARNPVLYADIALGAAETMLMEAFVLGKPAISTVYWQESKPLTELHRYIPHTINPKEAAWKTLQYLDPKQREEFRKEAKTVVDSMENPVSKMEEELSNLFTESSKKRPSTKRRSKIEIYGDILDILTTQSLKLTHIMQTANLSYSKVKTDLNWLTGKNLIEKHKNLLGEEHFKITLEGREVLSEYKQIRGKLL